MAVNEASSRTTRGERTRARLAVAARSVLAERGYAGTRVEDIVAVAGVSHGTFYTYFENKTEVLDVLIDAAAAKLQAVVDEPWEGPGGSTVAAVIDQFVTAFTEHGDVAKVWIEASAYDDHFLQRLHQVRSGYVRRVAQVLEPALEGSGHDPAVAAAALVAMVEGYATQGLHDRQTQDRSEVVRTLTNLWLGGVVRLADGPSGPENSR